MLLTNQKTINYEKFTLTNPKAYELLLICECKGIWLIEELFVKIQL